MRTSHADKWTTFYLSLIAPGAGQLWAGSWWCVGWWLGWGGAVGVWSWLVSYGSSEWWLIAGVQVVCFLAIAVVSAGHAKRQAEVDHPWPATPGTRVRVTRAPPKRRCIEATIEADIAAPPDVVWRRASDLPRFLVIDTFHDRVTLMRPRPAAGVDLVLSHNAFGRRFLRFGRILKWEEGRKYAFSDLSPRGPRHGFPHVFFVSVEPLSEEPITTRLTITVRGKWSSRWIPITLGRRWVWLVTRDHARLIRKAM
ncbi:MAG: SRPBCC family protein [Planctomycetes bacterium]|nr:SRPBCC family protein [Planctomycetota bacterium]